MHPDTSMDYRSEGPSPTSHESTSSSTPLSRETGTTEVSHCNEPRYKGHDSFVPAPVAICGISLRLPGDIRDTADFWDLLASGKDGRTPVPHSRYNAEGFNDSLGKREAIKTQWGYFINEDLSALDTSFFSFSKEELEKTDPQQRLLLEVARECFENAGEVAYRGKSIGCYIGTFGEDWLRMNLRDTQQPAHHTLTGYSDMMLANRISYEYDLKGPSIVLKTGCSASMVALHQACRALQNGDCSAALVAGSNLIMTPGLTSTMMIDGILSPDGSCKTFDAKADGFVRAEAVNAVYVKLLDDAIRDGNSIRAVIRNTAINSGGKSTSLTAPNGHSQETMMRKAYKECYLDPRDTPYVECHGTGTQTGDRIETSAVGRVFGERGVFIGSVKPNVGHSEAASGLTSLIKAVLALEKETIPPNIKFDQPNPTIDFGRHNLTVPVKATPWPSGRLRRISINSFGIGGANAHAIIDSYYGQSAAEQSSMLSQRTGSSLLLCTANTEESLQVQINLLKGYLEEHPGNLHDMAFTLAMRREHLTHRAYIITENTTTHTTSPPTKISPTIPNLVMVFSGQGAQWSRMGANLMDSDPNYLEDIRSMDRSIQTSICAPTWSLEIELRKGLSESDLQAAELAQPLCTAVQIALLNAYFRAGVRPVAVVGHSSGEIAAAYACGALTQHLAILTSYYRGYVAKSQTHDGTMAAVDLGRDDLDPLLCPGVVVACENSPNSSTISGERVEVEKSLTSIKNTRPDSLIRILKVDQAYHSRYMNKLATQYKLLLQKDYTKESFQAGPFLARFFSSVDSKEIHEPNYLGPEYWSSNLISPVLFASAVSSLMRQISNPLFLEIGPHSTLSSPLRQICSSHSESFSYISSMQRGGDCRKDLLSAFGQLFQNGISIRFDSIVRPGRILTDLPKYPWDRSSGFWNESRLSQEWRNRQFGYHELLGVRVPESTTLEPTWRSVLSLEDTEWLSDHKIQDDIVFPFSGYCAMAGEAVRQLTGNHIGYSIRDVTARNVLVLKSLQQVEIFTTLRPEKPDFYSEFDCWMFTISSYAGSTSLRHCEGLVKARKDYDRSCVDATSLTRSVDATKWYDAFAAAGHVYGPKFRCMESISSSTHKHEALSTIRSAIEHSEGGVFLHPTIIDACLQLALVSLTNGIGRKLISPRLPVHIQELDVSTHTNGMQAKASASANDGTFDIQCGNETQLALRISGLKFQDTKKDLAIPDADLHAATKLHWRPLINFVDHGQLFRPCYSQKIDKRLIEKVVAMCMLDSAERLQGLSTHKIHLTKYHDWLNTQITQSVLTTNLIIGDDLLDLTQNCREDRIACIKEDLSRLLDMADSRPFAMGIQRVWSNVESICSGATDPLDLLMEDDVLADIYREMSFDYSKFIQLLAHSNPSLRILEVGAGTGATTHTILGDLINDRGTPLYAEYVFTDISTGFLAPAKTRFSDVPNMDFKLFDISRDPFEQGFEAEAFDLIIATNVVHATPVLKETLQNLKVLLKPKGRLLLTELTCASKLPNFIHGSFSGWWLGEDDDRKTEPYISVDRWDKELKAAGFTGVDTAVSDAEFPLQYCTVIVSQPAFASHTKATDVRLTILSNKPHQDSGKAIIEEFQSSGSHLTICRLGDDLPPRQDIVSVLDYEGCGLGAMSEYEFLELRRLIDVHHVVRLFWLMRPAQITCQAPEAAMMIGMARGVRGELGMQFVTFEIEPSEPSFSKSVLQVVQHVTSRRDSEVLEPDWEFAFHDGFIKVGRYLPYSLMEEAGQIVVDEPNMSKVLEIETPGVLDTIKWLEVPTKRLLEVDEVEIQPFMVGINNEDMEYAQGQVLSMNEPHQLGMEAVGKVISVGSDVHHFTAGDIVMALAENGCATTRMIVQASLIVKVPEGLSLKSATTMPFSFVTALYALRCKCMLHKGHIVLIQSAASDIGQAAIQVCRMAGANILVTATNEPERRFLIDHFELPEDCIFDPNDDCFVRNVMHATKHQGADFVLNLTAGISLRMLWKCVNNFGVLIDASRQDGIDLNVLDLKCLSRNKSYHSIDMLQLIRERPQDIGRLLGETVDGYLQGHFLPVRQPKVVTPNEIVQALSTLQQQTSAGQIIIEMPLNPSHINACKVQKTLKLDSYASYLLTGGLGGLGHALALWMVERGARSLIFLSPHAGKSREQKSFITELESLGCDVNLQRGSAEVMEDVQRAVESTRNPIKGIVHLAMVLRDGPIVNMSYSDWNAAIKPKAQGAWNLHLTFQNQEQPLDFFVLGSSVFSTLEQPGQCNYNAGNLFLEALCQYRRQHQLAASVVNIAAMDEIGRLSKDGELRRKARAGGLQFSREQQFLDAFELAMMRSSMFSPAKSPSTVDSRYEPWYSDGQIIIGMRPKVSLDNSSNEVPWRRNRRMAVYHNLRKTTSSTHNASGSDELNAFLTRARESTALLKEQASADLLGEVISRKFAELMLRTSEDIPLDTKISEAGLDSLMAIELRRWWKQAFGLEVSALEIISAGTMRQLGKVAAEKLVAKLESSG